MSRDLRHLWALDPAVRFLNHGSFGACPHAVLDAAQRLRARIEREPVRFFVDELPRLLDVARAAVGELLGAAPDDIAFVPNATAGVSTVLRSLDLAPGDELLTTDHAYNACRNALDYVAARHGARVVVARVPFPLGGPDDVVEPVLGALTPHTRLALIDHVTSPTALVFPVERLVRLLAERGVETLVDAAHAPGMLPMNLERLGAAYTTGNFHKWVCAPKGAAFLHVRRDRQPGLRPLAISHGANSPRVDRSRFRLEFDWTGTSDPTPFLCVPEALRFLASLDPGGVDAVMTRNHDAAVAARRVICDGLAVEPPCPEEMLGSMASVAVPGTFPPTDASASFDPIQEALFQRFGIEIPIIPWPSATSRLVRISTPPYVEQADVEALVAALRALGLGR